MTRRYTTAEFIAKAKLVHGNKYDYSRVQYVDSVTPVCIICPEHGSFMQRPAQHLMGNGCSTCGYDRVCATLSDTQEAFLEKARKTHGDKYDYSLVNYQGSDKKVTIICPEHGAFLQTPHMHISGRQCPICGRNQSDENRKKGLDYFLQQAHEIHGDRYDYSKVDLIRRNHKVCIICREHGEFWQTPDNHVNSHQGCPKCARALVGQKNTKSTEWFLERARSIHGDKYDYSESNYVSARTKLCIICHEIDDGGHEHGPFWMEPTQHLNNREGCPKCGHPRHTTEWFSQEAKKKHGEVYDYSQTEYINNNTKLTVICKDHGPFEIFPNSHLRGAGCPKCAGRNLTTEEFIELARLVHGTRYDYSRVQYKNKTSIVRIICQEHGEFSQVSYRHLRGTGCPLCGASHNLSNKEEFIKKARATHGNLYDYSLTVYRGTDIPVSIICREHGVFLQAPHNHINGSKCPKCVGHERLTTSSFIERASRIHEGKFDYSKVEIVNSKQKVCIVCPEHGDFWQSPNAHLQGVGCKKCAGLFMDQALFLERARLVHGDKYGYDEVEYVNSSTKIKIRCPEHGVFLQAPSQHLGGNGCPKCAGKYMDTEFFVEKCTKRHGGKYDYSLVNYQGANKKVKIICPYHGVFEQVAYYHLSGNGCPMCNQSHLEVIIQLLLKKEHIAYNTQKTFPWLYNKENLTLDFWLPQYGVAIECQGEQHFRPISFFGGKESYISTVQRDTIKRELCGKHGIKMLYFSNLGIEYPYPVFEDTNLLIKAIYSNGIFDETSLKDPELPLKFE